MAITITLKTAHHHVQLAWDASSSLFDNMKKGLQDASIQAGCYHGPIICLDRFFLPFLSLCLYYLHLTMFGISISS